MRYLKPAHKLAGYDDTDFFYRYVGETHTHFLAVICSAKTKEVINQTVHAVPIEQFVLIDEADPLI